MAKMKELIDNFELERILEILEEMEDEKLSAALLMEFNQKMKVYGRLLMNTDHGLGNEEWKRQCDQAQKEVTKIVEKINSMSW